MPFAMLVEDALEMVVGWFMAPFRASGVLPLAEYFAPSEFSRSPRCRTGAG